MPQNNRSRPCFENKETFNAGTAHILVAKCNTSEKYEIFDFRSLTFFIECLEGNSE